MKKPGFIDKVRVGDPCTQAWDEMVGNDRVRFCKHCAKDVNNLSAMTRKEAIKLVRNAGGALCIRYVEKPQTAGPMFAEELTRLTRRRAPLMAAGVVSATLSLASLTYAQGGVSPSNAAPVPVSPVATQVSECEDKGTPDKKKAGDVQPAAAGALRGTVVDVQGGVVPNFEVKLYNGEGNAIAGLRSDDEGSVRFDRLPNGIYALQVEASSGFAASRVENIEINDGEIAVEIVLEASGVTATVGDVMVGPEFELPLSIAVSKDDLTGAKFLITRGENVNGKEEDGTTAIFIAVENGNVEMVQLLLDAGARVNIRNEDGQTALMRLDSDASVELVELLLRYGAKVNRVSDSGLTALMYAAYIAKPEVVKALVGAGADLDAKNADGMTSLMFAADSENLENARVLVLAGADVNLKDNDGETAWEKTTNAELEELLKLYGAVVEPEPRLE